MVYEAESCVPGTITSRSFISGHCFVNVFIQPEVSPPANFVSVTGPDGLHKANWQQLMAREELIVRRQTKRRVFLTNNQTMAMARTKDTRDPDAVGFSDENWIMRTPQIRKKDTETKKARKISEDPGSREGAKDPKRSRKRETKNLLSRVITTSLLLLPSRAREERDY
jgi:hypothetical protein